ncbi:MAG: MgtC/SapB family protein [Rhodanobacter sp.]
MLDTRGYPSAACVPQMLPYAELAIPLLLAALLGAVIGANRGRLEWAAGLRTHMLVSVGAALAMIVSSFDFADVLTRTDK